MELFLKTFSKTILFLIIGSSIALVGSILFTQNKTNLSLDQSIETPIQLSVPATSYNDLDSDNNSLRKPKERRIAEAAKLATKNKIQEEPEIIEHNELKEKLDIGPELIKEKAYKVHSMYAELYGGLCKPIFHRGGKILCDKIETLIKNVDFELTSQEAKTSFYRSKKNNTDGCFTFQWTKYGKIRITDFKDASCN